MIVQGFERIYYCFRGEHQYSRGSKSTLKMVFFDETYWLLSDLPNSVENISLCLLSVSQRERLRCLAINYRSLISNQKFQIQEKYRPIFHNHCTKIGKITIQKCLFLNIFLGKRSSTRVKNCLCQTIGEFIIFI